MPYILRNTNNDIASFHHGEPQGEGAEALSVQNQDEVIEFLIHNQMTTELRSILDYSDISLIRVLEDLIDLLCQKHVINFTDLPEPAQQKFTDRRRIRSGIEGIENLLMDEKDEGIF